MNEIELTVVFQNQRKTLKLSAPGGGTNGYQIIIEDYYHGQVCKMADGWHVYANDNSWLSEEDKEAILEKVKSMT